MKKTFFTISTLVLVSLAAKAEDVQRFSSKDWAHAWAEQALKSNQNPSFDTRAVERKFLAKCSDCENKESLNKARDLFEKNKFDEAILKYNAIPRGNTYWLTAVEEKGWAYFRQENYEKALAQTKTLLAPQFAEIVNSEAFLLQSLTQLKICDYKGVFETHTIFKEKQKIRMLEVQKLAEVGWNEDLANVIKKADRFPLTLNDMGDAVQHLPLLIYKDVEFQTQVLRFKAAATAISSLNAASELSSSKMSLLKNLEQLTDGSFAALKKRVRELASFENENNFKIIQKLNLVEVEAIQRVHTDMDMGEELYKKGRFQKVTEDQLVFMDDGKPWIDELDKFEVTAKTCVKGIRRKM